jgi:hypothetical protein
MTGRTVTDRLRAELAREETWLAGDWDSRSARGIRTMERHAAKRDELRALLGLPKWERPLPFPMPGTAPYQYPGVTVASVRYVDDERGELVLVLILERSAPFYTVAHYALTAFDPAANPDIPAPHGPAYARGELDVIGRFSNIVEAMDAYEQNGGDL